MRTPILITLAALAMPVGISYAEETLNLEDETTRINYSLGYQIGGDFKRQGVEMNPAAIVRASRTPSPGPSLDGARGHAGTLRELKRKVVTEQRARAKEAELEKVRGQAVPRREREEGGCGHHRERAAVHGGRGRRRKGPGPTDEVTVNYRGTLVNGNEFDSSYERGKPATFRLNKVIKGWTEGLQLIKAGGKIQLFVPPDLAYGDRGPLANQTLIFDVELLSVGAKAPAASPGVQCRSLKNNPDGSLLAG